MLMLMAREMMLLLLLMLMMMMMTAYANAAPNTSTTAKAEPAVSTAMAALRPRLEAGAATYALNVQLPLEDVGTAQQKKTAESFEDVQSSMNQLGERISQEVSK